MDIQARIPPATAAMHNFILDHDPEELDKVSEAPDPNPGNSSRTRFWDARGPQMLQEGLVQRQNATELRRKCGQYQAVLAERGEDFAFE